MEDLLNESAVWLVKGNRVDLSQPKVMGVLNLTPDSFFDGGKYYQDVDKALAACEQMVSEGALIIDVGGESTRPGSHPVSASEELGRVMPFFERAIQEFPQTLFSIDTYKAEVAQEALSAGVHIVNDISAGVLDQGLLQVVAGYDCGYVLMHMKGQPSTMQNDPTYEDVLQEVYAFFQAKLEELRKKNIGRLRVVLDPGIGFGKRLEDNLKLIFYADKFLALGRPLLYGVSMKSYLGKLLGRELEQRLAGTIATLVLLLIQGVKLLRVHDVASAIDAIRISQEFLNERIRVSFG